MFSRVCDAPKQPSLLVPVDAADDGPEVSLVEAFHGRQKKDLLLNVGREIAELHDLCHAASRNAAEPGQFRVVPKTFPPAAILQSGWRATSRAIRGAPLCRP